MGNMITASQARLLTEYKKATERVNRMYKFETEYPRIVELLDASVSDLADKGYDGVEFSLKELVTHKKKIVSHLRDCGYDVNYLDDETISIRWG